MTVAVIWSYIKKMELKILTESKKQEAANIKKMSFECPWQTWKTIPENYLSKLKGSCTEEYR